MIALILAHYDDEIFALDYILKLKEKLLVIYISDSHYPSSTTKENRIQECQKSWKYLSLQSNLVLFGNDQNLGDGKVFKDLNKNHLLILDNMIKQEEVREILSFTFEGGHQDHDMASQVARYLASKNKIDFRHFPSYSKGKSSFPIAFKVMKMPPYCDCKKLISVSRFLRVKTSFRILLIYKSQWRTWLGLGLPILLNNLKSHTADHSCAMQTMLESKDYLWVNRKRADYQDFSYSLDRLFDHDWKIL